MANELKLRSMATFSQVQVPFNQDDLDTMSLEFTYSLPWLSFNVVEKGKAIKYKIDSIVGFADWLIKFDSIAVKDDYGYIWNGSYWQEMKDKELFVKIDSAIIFICDKLHISSNRKRELKSDIKTYIRDASSSFDNSIKENYIAFKNWTLDVKANNFFTPRKEMNIIGGFDFEPVANVEPTTWIRYAEYMFGDNAKFLWAWLGYAFQSNFNWKQGALFLLDPWGGTGKTYFVTKITQAMFGERRIGAFKLKSLQGNTARFETARFVGKALMIDDDASEVYFNEDDVFKSVTGGGLSPVERKGVDGTDYKITAKIIANVNKMPKFKDAGAIKRRLHIIKTVAPIADNNIAEIEKRGRLFPEYKLQEEIPRLATYAIETYQQAVKENWQINGSIVDDIVAQDPFNQWRQTIQEGEYSANGLYMSYCEFFEDLELPKDEMPLTRNKFGREMSNWYTKKKTMNYTYYLIQKK